MKKFKTVNEMLELTLEEIKAIPVENILEFSYGIPNFSFYGDYTQDRGNALGLLKEIFYANYKKESEKPLETVPVSQSLVRCSCGHKVEKHLVMSASLGSSCPDCYDRLSN